MKTTHLVALSLVALVLADDARSQRRRFRRGPPPQQQAERKEANEAKEKVEHWLAVSGGDVHLGTGQILRRATVLVGDDEIHAVGHDLEVPEEAEVVDARGKVVTPGFVAVKARGMGAPRSPSGKARDEVNPFEPQIKMGLAAGITSFLATFDQGSDKPGGKTAVIKNSWGDLDGMVAAENSVYSMRVPLSPAQWKDFRELVEKAEEYLAEKTEAETDEGTEQQGEDAEAASKKKPKPPKGSEALLAVLRDEAVLWVTSAGRFESDDLRQALEIARLLGKGVVLDEPITAWVVPDEVAATGSMAVVSPRDRVEPDPGRPDRTGSNLASAAILADAGVPVAVTPGGGRFGGGPSLGTGGILGQDLHTLHLDAAFAVRGGMDDREALRTITSDAAKILGVGSRLGSIEPGKDADLLILDGDPLHYRTFVDIAIVNGKIVYEKQKEPFYSHIDR